MASVRQLGKEDMLFVAGETAEVYQHTAGLVILDTSNCPNFSFEYLREKVIERIREIPHFRWRLEEVPLALDMPYWVEDEDFRYENHFKRIAVPSPGDREALSEVVAHLYSKHLDRSKPLWEFWLIEGLADGKYAVLQKLHHCMMDGQGASKLGELLCDFEPDAKPRPVDASIRNARAGDVPDWLSMTTTTALHLAQFPGAMYRQAFDMLGPKLLETVGLKKKSHKKSSPEIPLSRFNGEVGTDRGFVFGSLSLADIKTVRKAFDVSVNDVLLALVSTSVRDYLEARNELPRLSLKAGIPVSLRTDEDDQVSNRVTQAPVTLATDLADPVARLKAISADCEEAKQLIRGGGKGLLELMQTLPPWMVTAMMGVASPEQASQMLGSNLIVANVRGSDKPMYIAGARLDTMFPMSIITQGLGINFTCVSYANQVDVGIAIEPQLVPDPWTIVDGMQHALDEYLALTAKPARRRKSSRAGSAKRSTAKTAARKKASTKGNATAGKKIPRKHRTSVTASKASDKPKPD
jgi:diacylglycerol O-acyltransferase